jgi:hypothetical protein
MISDAGHEDRPLRACFSFLLPNSSRSRYVKVCGSVCERSAAVPIPHPMLRLTRYIVVARRDANASQGFPLMGNSSVQPRSTSLVYSAKLHSFPQRLTPPTTPSTLLTHSSLNPSASLLSSSAALNSSSNSFILSSCFSFEFSTPGKMEIMYSI